MQNHSEHEQGLSLPFVGRSHLLPAHVAPDERVELLVVGAVVGVEQRALLGLQLARVAAAAPQAARVVLAAAA